MFKRIIKDGKLNLICQLIGGPVDGTIVNGDIDIIRIPQHRFLTAYLSKEDVLSSSFNSINYHQYERTSEEKYTYIGISI